MGASASKKSMASSDLLWQITRNNSSFLVKRNGLQLSSEPGNLMNKNSFKFSGIATFETVDVADNEKGITFSRKNKANTSKPARNVVSMDLKKDLRKVSKTIINKTAGANYRKDLSNAALARWCKVWKSQHRK